MLTRSIGRLLVTGFPGWLTDALFCSFQKSWPRTLSRVRLFVEPRWRGVKPQWKHRLELEPELEREFEPKFEPKFEIVYADLRDPIAVRSALEDIDTVLHAAGVIHVNRTRDWYEINARSTKQLAELSAHHGVKRFVYISSNAAAGSSRNSSALTEKDPPSPRSHYGKSKYLGELSVRAAGIAMETVILRPCMFYGPPVPRRHIEVYRRILSGRMPMVGNGDFARSLTHIENGVEAVRLALEHPRAAGQTYFVADDGIYTTKQIMAAMAQALGIEMRLWRLPRMLAPIAYAMDQALARFGIYWPALHLLGEADWNVGVSSEKIKGELGYQPKISLHEGMKQALDWCVSQRLLCPPTVLSTP